MSEVYYEYSLTASTAIYSGRNSDAWPVCLIFSYLDCIMLGVVSD